MTITSVITGWMHSIMSPAPAKLDGSPADVQHNIAFGGGGTFANKRVTADSTMSLSTAWASVRLNSRTVASCGRKLYRRTSALQREVAEDHPLYRVLAISPNPDQTPMEFWEGQVTALNLRGNAYARISRRGDGQVVALWPLSPDTVNVYRDANGDCGSGAGGAAPVLAGGAGRRPRRADAALLGPAQRRAPDGRERAACRNSVDRAGRPPPRRTGARVRPAACSSLVDLRPTARRARADHPPIHKHGERICAD